MGRRNMEVLLVEDADELRRALTRAIDSVVPVISAATVAEAMEIVALHGPFAGALIDAYLPDGYGLDILRKLRASDPQMPALVMSGVNRPEPARDSHLLDATFVPKPVPPANIAHFIRVVDAVQHTDAALGRAIAQYAEQHQLRTAELRLLAVALAGVERRHLAQSLGVSPNTVKSQIRALLARTDEPTLEAVECRVLALAASGLARSSRR